MEYKDILYTEEDGIATITINRPDKYNAFRGETVEELIHAFNIAGWNNEIGVIVLTGAGDKAFCTGGDQSSHGDDGTTGMAKLTKKVSPLIPEIEFYNKERTAKY